MFNAVIDSLGDAGRLKDYYGAPERDQRTKKRFNLRVCGQFFTAATGTDRFVAGRSRPEESQTMFEARRGVLPAKVVLSILEQMHWHPDYSDKVVAPTLRFYRGLLSAGRLNDFVIIWPQLTSSIATRTIPGIGDGQVITRNRRQPPRLDFVGSDSKHRNALERIAGTATTVGDPAADALRDPNGRRGAVLLYVTADPSDRAGDDRTVRAQDLPPTPPAEDLVPLLSLVAPATATPRGRSVIEWGVRRRADRGTPTVDAI